MENNSLETTTPTINEAYFALPVATERRRAFLRAKIDALTNDMLGYMTEKSKEIEEAKAELREML